jgi:hypothetical protein
VKEGSAEEVEVVKLFAELADVDELPDADELAAVLELAAAAVLDINVTGASCSNTPPV